jgi:peptide deformylase
MFATMYAAEGVGLAATQVGVDLAVFVYDCPDDDQVRHVGVLCNAEVVVPEGKSPGTDAPFVEDGLLVHSDRFDGMPSNQAKTAIVEVTATGLLARCLQHETDHLNGIVFGDRLSGRARKKLYSLHQDAADLYPDDWPVTPRADSA